MGESMAVTGRPHSTTSEIKLIVADEFALGLRYEAHVKRDMHLNRPYGDEAKHMKKRISWWNIAAQETRAEGINFIEKELGRELTLLEWISLSTESSNVEAGIATIVIVWVA